MGNSLYHHFSNQDSFYCKSSNNLIFVTIFIVRFASLAHQRYTFFGGWFFNNFFLWFLLKPGLLGYNFGLKSHDHPDFLL